MPRGIRRLESRGVVYKTEKKKKSSKRKPNYDSVFEPSPGFIGPLQSRAQYEASPWRMPAAARVGGIRGKRPLLQVIEEMQGDRKAKRDGWSGIGSGGQMGGKINARLTRRFPFTTLRQRQ